MVTPIIVLPTVFILLDFKTICQIKKYDEKKYYMIVSYDKNDNMTYKTFDNEEDYKKAKNW